MNYVLTFTMNIDAENLEHAARKAEGFAASANAAVAREWKAYEYNYGQLVAVDVTEAPEYHWSPASAMWQVQHGEADTPRTLSARAWLDERESKPNT